MKNYKFKGKEKKYCCVHGQCDHSAGKKGKYEYFFLEVTNDQVSTGREFLETFDTLEEMKKAFPGKNDDINDQLKEVSVDGFKG